MDENDIRNIVKSWYARARRERDAVSTFVFLWFCFNAWLGFESQEDTDRAMINWLKKATPKSVLVAAFGSARGSTVFASNLAALAKLSPITSTGRRYKEVRIASANDYPNLVEGIYQVRCNLFHGGKRANDVRGAKLLKVCAAILEKWVGNLQVQMKESA